MEDHSEGYILNLQLGSWLEEWKKKTKFKKLYFYGELIFNFSSKFSSLINLYKVVYDGGGPSTPTQGSQGPSQGERLDQDQGERLGREGERLGREGERLGREGGRLPLELDRLGPLTRSMAKHIQTQANEATDGREKALYMFA